MLTEPGDAAAFAAAIAALVDDPARCDQLGAAASARAQERWSRLNILDRFAARLETLVAKPGGMA